MQTRKSPIKQVVEISSGTPRKQDKNFRTSELVTSLHPESKFTKSLVRKFERDSGRLASGPSEEAIQNFAKDRSEAVEVLLNEQAKIFNKILWIKILSERVIEDNSPEVLKFDSKKNLERQSQIGKMKQEIFKTGNYLQIVEKWDSQGECRILKRSWILTFISS